MRWIIVTCEATRHIVPAQQWLFKKYAPQVDTRYLDLGKNDINRWGPEVADMLPDEDLVVFGLDDYLPIDHLDMERLERAADIVFNTDIDRFELGWGAVHGYNEGRHIQDSCNGIPFLRYPGDGLYTVSCQFSVWKTRSLKRILRAATTPWNFELKHRAAAACFEEPVFHWTEESALSNRHPGKINVLGIRRDDLCELIGQRLVDPTAIQFGMPKGPVPPFDIKTIPSRYKKYYL
jgi:hypothetical protein